jgi:repressor LexA
MNFGKNLRVLRKENKLGQDDLAKILKYNTFSTVQKWEEGSSFPRVDTLIKIADYFNVNIDNLLYSDYSNKITSFVSIPIIGIVKGGYGYYPKQELFGDEYVKKGEGSGAEYFYLKVVGDSMIDFRIIDGDIAYIRSQNTVDNNDIAVVLTDEDEVTLKKIKFDKKGMYLIAGNEKYDSRFFSNEDIAEKNIRILGKLIHTKIMF